MIMNGKKQISAEVNSVEEEIEYTGLRTDSIQVNVNNSDRTISADLIPNSIIGTGPGKAYSSIQGETNRSWIKALERDLDAETERAKESEFAIKQTLKEASITLRGDYAEQKVRLDAEIARSTSVDNTIDNKLSAESQRAIAAELELQTSIEQTATDIIEDVEAKDALLSEQINQNKQDIESIYIPSKLSEFENDSGYALRQEVEQKTDSLQIQLNTTDAKVEENLAKAIAYTDECVKEIFGEDVDEAYNSFKEIQDLLKEDEGVTKNLLSDVSMLKKDVSTKAELEYVNDSFKGTEQHIRDVSETLELKKADKKHTHSLEDVVDYKEPDLTPYAKTTDIPTNVSQLVNDSEYLQQEDLTGYATEDFVSDLLGQGLDTKSDIDHVHDIYDIKNYSSIIPKKVSELENDKGYLTEHQSLSHKADKIHYHVLSDIEDYEPVDLSPYATKYWVEDKNYLTEHQSLEEYAKKSDLPTNVSDLVNDSDYADKTFVNDTAKVLEENISTRATKLELDDSVNDINKTILAEIARAKEAEERNAASIEALAKGVSEEQIDGVYDLVKYVTEHGPEVIQMQQDIDANSTSIDEVASDVDVLAENIAKVEAKIPTKNSHIENDTKYTTEEQVAKSISDIGIENYYNKSDIQQLLLSIEFIDGGNAPL